MSIFYRVAQLDCRGTSTKFDTHFSRFNGHLAEVVNAFSLSFSLIEFG